MPTSHESTTACEDDRCVEGSITSPATVYFVHAFKSSLEVNSIDRTKSYLTHWNL